MGRLEDRIAEIRAAIAQFESEQSAQGRPDLEAGLQQLRSELTQLEAPVSPSRAGSIESERRIVTVLFADLSGFTALAETMDPEETRELLQAFYERMSPIVAKYRGTIEKFIGDEIMAIFGAPIASETDPEFALRAALEMRREFDRFSNERALEVRLHFGINTGLVIAGSLGNVGQEQYTVTGDAVNVASRLCDASAENQIVVGLDTYRLTAALFDFEELPPLSAKGKAKPLQVFSLLRVKASHDSVRGTPGFRSRLVGRDKEVREIQDAIQRLQDGHGAVVSICGEAGMGKSRLIAESRQRLSSAVHWVEARAVSYGERLSYGVVRTLIEAIAGLNPEEPVGRNFERLRAEVEAAVPGRGDEVFPYLAHLCELPLEGELAERVKFLGPEALYGQLLHSFQAFVRGRATAERLALVWEDLHWIDPSSLRLLEMLLPLTAEVPLLIVLVARSFREGHVAEFFSRASAVPNVPWHKIELSALARESSQDLARNLLGLHDQAVEIPALVLERAEGNPFFLEELLRGLVEAGLVTLESNQAPLARAKEMDVPPTVQALIAARVDRLAQSEKRVLEAASVIGRIFQGRVLKRVVPGEQESLELERLLAELVRREMIRQRDAERLFPERDYIFKHAITQEVTYQGMSLARRRVLHRATAEVIQALFPDRLEELAATLAHHYEKAEDAACAVPFLTQAADRARRSYANEEALHFYSAALKQAERFKTKQPARWGELAPKLLESLGDTLVAAARYEDARGAFRDALALARQDDRVTKARLLRKQGTSWNQQRRLAESVLSYDAAQTALGVPPDQEDVEWWKEWIAIGLDRIGAYYHLNRLSDLASLTEELRPAVERFGTPSQRRDLIDSLTLFELRSCGYLMPPEQGLARTRELIADSLTTGDLNDVAHFEFVLGFIHLYREELGRAREALETALATAVRIGDVVAQTKCVVFLSVVHRKSDRPVEAERFAAQALSLARRSQNSAYSAAALAQLAWVVWRAGNLEQAHAHARAALDFWPSDSPFLVWGLWPLLGVAFARNELESVAHSAREILGSDLMRMPAELQSALRSGLAAFARSDRELARTCFQHACEMARGLGYL